MRETKRSNSGDKRRGEIRRRERGGEDKRSTRMRIIGIYSGEKEPSLTASKLRLRKKRIGKAVMRWVGKREREREVPRSKNGVGVTSWGCEKRGQVCISYGKRRREG